MMSLDSHMSFSVVVIVTTLPFSPYTHSPPDSDFWWVYRYTNYGVSHSRLSTPLRNFLKSYTHNNAGNIPFTYHVHSYFDRKGGVAEFTWAIGD